MKKIIIFCLAVALFFLNITAAYAAISINDLSKQKKEIQKEKNLKQQAVKETQYEKNRIQQEIDSIDFELDEVLAEIDRLSEELSRTQKNLEKTEAELDVAITDKNNQYETLKKRIRVMYENGSIGYLRLIFEADSISDFLNRIEYINRIMQYDQKVLSDYQELENTISIKLGDIESHKLDLQVMTNQKESKKKTLNETIEAKSSLIMQLSQEEKNFNDQIAQLDKEENEISSLIKQEQKKLEAASRKVYSYSGGRLLYPVPAYQGAPVNSGYGPRKSPISGRSEFHTGIDLKATMSTDIVAAEKGVVIFSGKKSGYGNTIIINHGNGLSTLYAHNSKLVAEVGAEVSRGQVVAKAGSTGYSTGVHLHFEVRVNGAHTNPIPYLTK